MSQYPPPPGEYPGGSQQPMGQKPPSNLVWGILTTLLCCLPFGIVSIVYAAKVDGRWTAGDVAGAKKASDDARKWAIISAVLGVIVGIIYAAVLLGSGDTSS